MLTWQDWSKTCTCTWVCIHCMNVAWSGSCGRLVLSEECWSAQQLYPATCITQNVCQADCETKRVWSAEQLCLAVRVTQTVCLSSGLWNWTACPHQLVQLQLNVYKMCPSDVGSQSVAVESCWVAPNYSLTNPVDTLPSETYIHKRKHATCSQASLSNIGFRETGKYDFSRVLVLQL